MPPISPAVAHHRARRANAIRHGDAELADETARELAYLKLEAEINKVVENLPPLTDDQRAKLARLLNG